MVRAWYLEEIGEGADCRLPHQPDPPHFLTLDQLNQQTGLEHFKIDVKNVEEDATLNRVRKERGYNYEDILNLTPEVIAEKMAVFYEEHLHADEEIRLVLEGEGYFDTRDRNDRWIRVEVREGDMVILPAGIYHRFTVSTGNMIKVKRYFKGVPVWTCYPRAAANTDKMQERMQYLKVMAEVEVN